jgi:hypothetical protein
MVRIEEFVWYYCIYQNSGKHSGHVCLYCFKHAPMYKTSNFLRCLLFCPITLVSDNHFRFFFSRLDYFLGDNLKLCLKVSAVIARRGHASLFVENGYYYDKLGLKPPAKVS